MRKFGLIGKNISYSFSKAYFSEKFIREDLEKCTYENYDLQDITRFSEIIEDKELCGLNVTIPYKEQVLSYLHELDDVAEKIGAVNTIAFLPDGRLKGYNTDYLGFMQALTPMLHPEIRSALILGTGGASKAIAFALQQLKIDFHYVSRTPEKNMFSYTDLTKEIIDKHLLIIQSTPLGTFPKVDDKPDLPYHLLTPKHVLYDLVYNPAQTAFMKAGLAQKATVSNGLSMLIGQAEAAWEIWNIRR